VSSTPIDVTQLLYLYLIFQELLKEIWNHWHLIIKSTAWLELGLLKPDEVLPVLYRKSDFCVYRIVHLEAVHSQLMTLGEECGSKSFKRTSTTLANITNFCFKNIQMVFQPLSGVTASWNYLSLKKWTHIHYPILLCRLYIKGFCCVVHAETHRMFSLHHTMCL
jgi:hypothetical protein